MPISSDRRPGKRGNRRSGSQYAFIRLSGNSRLREMVRGARGQGLKNSSRAVSPRTCAKGFWSPSLTTDPNLEVSSRTCAKESLYRLTNILARLRRPHSHACASPETFIPDINAARACLGLGLCHPETVHSRARTLPRETRHSEGNSEIVFASRGYGRVCKAFI
jgi:hypothetical protein